MVYNIETTTMLTGSIQNNEVKIIFNPRLQKLFVGDSLKIFDETGQGVIVQAYKLESYDPSTEDLKLKSQIESYLSVTDENSLDDLGSIHIANCIFKYSIIKNKWIKWRGNLPTFTDYVEVLNAKDIISYTIGSAPLNQTFIGNYSSVNPFPIQIETSFLEGISLITGNNDINKFALLDLIKSELLQKDAKVLVIDTKGEYSNSNNPNIIAAGENYKLFSIDQNNPNHEWMFTNNKEESFSLGNKLLESNNLILNLSDIPIEFQGNFIIQSINDILNNGMCVFIIFNETPTSLDPIIYEKLVYINHQNPINFIFCANGWDNIPYPILRAADNYFLFSCNNFNENSQNFNNLKSDKKLLSQLLEYLPDNGFILYGNLTSNYPLIVELETSNYISQKAKHFGAVKKQMSESGEIIYSYKTIDSDPKSNLYKSEKNQEQDSYLETYKSMSQEYQEVDLSEEDEPEENFEFDIDTYEDDQDTYGDNQEEDDNDEDYDDEEQEEEEVPVIIVKPSKKFPPSKQKINTEDTLVPGNVHQKLAKTKKEPVPKESALKKNLEQTKKPAKNQPKEMPIKNITPRAAAIPDHIDDIPVYGDPSISEGSGKFQEGDHVMHERYGIGVINRVITTGDKQLCSIQFQDYGRRLLDPNRGLQKIE